MHIVKRKVSRLIYKFTEYAYKESHKLETDLHKLWRNEPLSNTIEDAPHEEIR